MRDYMINCLSFISNLSGSDFIFFCAMISLLILILVMFYIIKINFNNDEIEKTILTINEDVPNIPEKLKDDELSDEELAIIDLDTLTNKLSNEEVSNQTYDSLSEYERMQEEQAIISYDELVSKKRNDIRYTEELEITPDLKVKQIDINSLNEKPNRNSVTINLDEEETFLQTLKMLQNNL